MATITEHDIAPLHKHLSITLTTADYLPTFEKSLKDYSRKANIPGFRKGMVPAGLIKKMYGSSLFVDEVLRKVDQEVTTYIQSEKLNIFAQPLPVEVDVQQLDVHHPADYHFTFEVGVKPPFELPDLTALQVSRYKVEVTEQMVAEEVERLRQRYGTLTELEAVENEEQVLGVTLVEVDAAGEEVEGGLRKDTSLPLKSFSEEVQRQLMGKRKEDSLLVQLSTAFEQQQRAALLQELGISEEEGAQKHFRLLLTRIGQLVPRALDEAFFSQLFGEEVTTEEAFRTRIKEELQQQWEGESRNQLHHQLYHLLLEHTTIDLPQAFLKRWIKTQGQSEQPKSEEQLEAEFPSFLHQLKWTLITEKLVQQAAIEVSQEDLRLFAKEQLLGYMGSGALDEEQQWVRDYIERMLKDRKYVEDAYQRLQTQKMFQWLEEQVQASETPISKENFLLMNEQHQHQHHKE